MTPVQQRFINWILEREKAREAKILGEPYTGDPIIEKFRFCNVNREHDNVTEWIAQNVRPALAKKPLAEVIYQLYICRVFNEPECLEDIVPLVTHKTALNRLQHRRKAGLKLLRGAYLVVPHGQSVDVEVYYMNLAAKVRKLEYGKPTTLKEVADVMLKLDGLGEFMVNQVCTDLRYQPGHDTWADWKTFVLAGPGTRRGLARYLTPPGATTPRNPKGRISQRKGPCESVLIEIRADLVGRLPDRIAHHLQDINNLSNCFCEFDKYERARDGEASLRRYQNGNHQS